MFWPMAAGSKSSSKGSCSTIWGGSSPPSLWTPSQLILTFWDCWPRFQSIFRMFWGTATSPCWCCWPSFGVFCISRLVLCGKTCPGQLNGCLGWLPPLINLLLQIKQYLNVSIKGSHQLRGRSCFWWFCRQGRWCFWMSLFGLIRYTMNIIDTMAIYPIFYNKPQQDTIAVGCRDIIPHTSMSIKLNYSLWTDLENFIYVPNTNQPNQRNHPIHSSNQ